MPRRSRAPLFLICLLLSAYLLIYVSTPVDADGQALLAVAVTAVQHGRLDMNIIGYTEWLLTPDGRMGNLGIDGALYAKKGPTPSLALIPLVILAHITPWLPIQATAMLFNALITTATALALYTLARWLDYDERTAFTLGLIYGLATFAAAYVKTLFGEPLAGFLLLLAVMFAYSGQRSAFGLKSTYKPSPQTPRPHGKGLQEAEFTDGRLVHSPFDSSLIARYSLLVTGTLLALLIGVNTVYVVFVPVIGLYVFWWQKIRPLEIAKFFVPVVVGLGLLGLYNWARFGSPFTSGYHFAEGEGFNNPLLIGLYGLFFSPYRGLFWYNPILILAIPGWMLLRRRTPMLAWLSLVLITLQALAFASWWSWHGGIVWGPRFLLPALPLAMFMLAPIIDAARKQRFLFVTLGVFTLLSLGVQILGSLYDYLTYDGYLRIHYWPDLATANETLRNSRVMFDPTMSPITGHLALLKAGWRTEPVWMTNGLDVIHLGASLALIAVGIFLALSRRLGLKRAWLIAIPAIFISLNIVAARQNSDAVHDLEHTLQPPGMVVTATTHFDTALMDVDNGARILSMNAPTPPDDPLAQTLWDYALHQDKTLWYLTWYGMADPANWQEHQLWETAYFVTQRTIANHRALRFDLTPPIEPKQTGGWHFDSIRLDSYAFSTASDGARISLEWSANQPLAGNASWFVHLLDGSGEIVVQQDRQPQGGYAPTGFWTPDQPVTDRLFFPLPPGTDTSGWQVRIGWIDPTTGERLDVFYPDTTPLSEGFIILPLKSESP